MSRRLACLLAGAVEAATFYLRLVAAGLRFGPGGRGGGRTVNAIYRR